VNDDPTNPDPNVRYDTGQWISGASISTEPVAAGELQPGDALLLDDGTRAEVTDIRTGDFWLNTGRHGPGVALGWRAGSSSGVMFRDGSDVVRRVTNG
jgi:hypothetical protein